MKFPVHIFLVFGLMMLSGLVGGISWREAGYGSGPRDSSRAAEGPLREVAFVANAADGTVSLLDLASKQVLTTVDVIPDGKRVGPFRDIVQWVAQPFLERRAGPNFVQDTDLSRDGRVLFVSRGHLGDVVALDIVTGKILWRTPLAGLFAGPMALSVDGQHLYIAAPLMGDNRVEVLDSSNGERAGAIRAGQWPFAIQVSVDDSKVFVASLGDMQKPAAERAEDRDAYQIAVVDSGSLKPEMIYRFESGVRPFQVAPDGRMLYAQLSALHGLVAVDLVSHQRAGHIQLPVMPGVTEADWDFEAPHHGLALSGGGRLLCAAGRASDYAALVEVPALKVRETVSVGDAPGWAAFAAADSLCLLANSRSNDVSLVEVASQREIKRIPVGRSPNHITVGFVPEAIMGSE